MCRCRPWIWVAGALGAFGFGPERADGQVDRRATAASTRFDPFANSATNPYLNPLATQVPANRTTAGLYFLSARRQWKEQTEAAERERVASLRDRSSVGGLQRTRPEHSYIGDGRPDAFLRGTTIGRGAHFGRRGRYFP